MNLRLQGGSAASSDEARYFLPQRCDLCPRHCGVNRFAGQRGFCGASDKLVLARAALHFWEEPPISGNKGSGTVFFSYCPLHCLYCQNEPIASGETGKAISIDRLAEICLELQEQGALNINCVTPTHYTPLIIEAIRRARDQGLALPVVWNTSGYENPQVISQLAGTVQIYLSDFKYASAELASRYSEASDYSSVALRAIEEMLKNVGEPVYDEVEGTPRLKQGVVVRHLMLPTCLDDSKQVVRLLYEHFGDSLLLSLMNQYTPLLNKSAEKGNARAQAALQYFPELGGRVLDEEYERLLDYADKLGVQDYFWQEGPSSSESFIPAFDLSGIERKE